MANEVQEEIDRVVQKFSGELLRLFQKAALAALTGRGGAGLPAPAARRGRPPAAAKGPKAAKSPRRGRGGPKSSPVEVAKLGDKLVEILRKKGEPMPAKELLKAAGVDDGQFHYALSKAKADGRISQIGERRMARYQVGNGTAKAAAPKRGGKPGRKPGKGAKPGRKPGRKPAAEAAAAEATPAAE